MSAQTHPRAFNSTLPTYGPRWINPKGTSQALNDVLASEDGKDKAPKKENDEDKPAVLPRPGLIHLLPPAITFLLACGTITDTVLLSSPPRPTARCYQAAPPSLPSRVFPPLRALLAIGWPSVCAFSLKYNLDNADDIRSLEQLLSLPKTNLVGVQPQAESSRYVDPKTVDKTSPNYSASSSRS
ncbi:hypothetical protein D9619_003887 [Psilocybe cf. subviscida]|uniref:Uncharacterized protein n=1 Tax=Psilocybe cf. subviscida TaxID=2480587 RepID=A0A8H5BP60_9AGAR|nr:hypothetical protein D9619_003887 [Psilocybe cf. subviscida]